MHIKIRMYVCDNTEKCVELAGTLYVDAHLPTHFALYKTILYHNILGKTGGVHVYQCRSHSHSMTMPTSKLYYYILKTLQFANCFAPIAPGFPAAQIQLCIFVICLD